MPEKDEQKQKVNMTKKNEEGLIVQSESSALSIMADRFNVEPKKLLNTLKSTVFKNATNDELLTLVVVANEYKLNPLTRQIYAFPNSQGGGHHSCRFCRWVDQHSEPSP